MSDRNVLQIYLGSTISGSRHNHPPPQALCNTSLHIQPSSGDGTKQVMTDAGNMNQVNL